MVAKSVKKDKILIIQTPDRRDRLRGLLATYGLTYAEAGLCMGLSAMGAHKLLNGESLSRAQLAKVKVLPVEIPEELLPPLRP
jgi:hypothetical protein